MGDGSEGKGEERREKERGGGTGSKVTGYGGESVGRGMNGNGLFLHLIFCFILTMNLPHQP